MKIARTKKAFILVFSIIKKVQVQAEVNDEVNEAFVPNTRRPNQKKTIAKAGSIQTKLSKEIKRNENKGKTHSFFSFYFFGQMENYEIIFTYAMQISDWGEGGA